MKKLVKAGIGALVAAAVIVVPAMPAHADGQAAPCDIVGVGSDTLQYGADFLFEGSPAGTPGFNSGSLARRVFSFDAVSDAFGHNTPNSGAVLRQNTVPVIRPNGSGSGITAMLADTGATEVINFTRMSSLPTAANKQTAVNNGWGGLHTYQFATDGLGIAVRKAGSNAPALDNTANSGTNILSDLVHIYDANATPRYLKWGDIPGYTGPAPGNDIHPHVPQSGSGTRNFFLAQLQAANNNVAITLGANVVQTDEEHDPTPIAADADAIAPFSSGRTTLLDSGYFGASFQNTVQLLTGNSPTPDAGPAYHVDRGVYFVVRERDVNDTTGVGLAPGCFPFQPGGTRNWVKTLFSGATSWVARSANAPLITAAGLTPNYQDLGL